MLPFYFFLPYCFVVRFMGKVRDFLSGIGILSNSPVSAKKASKGTDNTGKMSKPGLSTSSLEEKRRAAREYMRKKRADEKANGISEKELARRRKQNRLQMRRLRARKKQK